MSSQLRIDPLGRPANFLMPSLKLKQKDDTGHTVEDRLESYLLEEFGGYTASAGSIYGKWRGPDGEEYYGEHIRFTVAFRGAERIQRLLAFLAGLAAEIDEQTLYVETGEDAWLVHATRADGAQP
jgi:hypothetical protein